jgi:RND family efflux transporter MFP subunit
MVSSAYDNNDLCSRIRRIGLALLGQAWVLGRAWVAVPIMMTGCVHPEAIGADTDAGRVVVAAVKASRTTVVRSETFEGEFRPFEQIDLHPKVAGFVMGMAIDIGDPVKAGQTLATIEVPCLDRDILRAEAQVKRDQAIADQDKTRYDLAHQEFTRLAGVAKEQSNLIAQQDIDGAQQKDADAWAQWQAAISQAGISRAELDKLRQIDAYRTVSAPFPGTIIKRFADPGAFVQGGVTSAGQATPLVVIARNDLLRLSFPITESLVSRVTVGEPVSIRIESLGNEIRSGTIARFSRHIADATRTMDVEIDVPNPDLRITPGMYASVTIVVDRHEHVVTVPPEAVRRQRDKAMVYAVDADQHIVEHPVTIGLEGSDRMEITTGIDDGAVLVYGNLDKTKPGQAVIVKLLTSALTSDGS